MKEKCEVLRQKTEGNPWGTCYDEAAPVSIGYAFWIGSQQGSYKYNTYFNIERRQNHGKSAEYAEQFKTADTDTS